MATIIAAVRASSFAQKQIEEVYADIIKHHPHVHFKPLFIEVRGDNHSKASPQQEIDAALLKRRCNIAIHSAKEFSNTKHEELTVAAITQSELTIVVRSDAHAMLKLFACIDIRQLQLH